MTRIRQTRQETVQILQRNTAHVSPYIRYRANIALRNLTREPNRFRLATNQSRSPPNASIPRSSLTPSPPPYAYSPTPPSYSPIYPSPHDLITPPFNLDHDPYLSEASTVPYSPTRSRESTLSPTPSEIHEQYIFQNYAEE